MLEIEAAITEKLHNVTLAAFCNISVEADSISSQSLRLKHMFPVFYQGVPLIFLFYIENILSP